MRTLGKGRGFGLVGLTALLGVGALGGSLGRSGLPAVAHAGVASDCFSDSVLCLSDGRFRVEATWTAPDGSTGAAHPVALTTDSGYFWFFDPDNVELAVKVLNGCGINARYWVFGSGLTNLEVVLTVTDSATGQSKTYTNAQGNPFQPILDTAALETCSTAAVTESAGRHPEEPLADSALTAKPAGAAPARSSDIGCTETDNLLCLDGRFAVEASWQTVGGAAGLGMAVPLTANSGYFWFFEPSNVEVIVKRLDACAIGRGQWFFGAGMTDVGVVLQVTDTFTGEVKTYTNVAGSPFAPIQDTSAFAFCPTPTPTPTVTPTATSTRTRKPLHTATPTPSQTPRAPVHVVNVGSCRILSGRLPCFQPNQIHVRRGDDVLWMWTGTHSTTSGNCVATKSGSTCVADGRWDSGNRTGNPATFIHRFEQVGTFHYFCRVGYTFLGHRSEVGIIVVDP